MKKQPPIKGTKPPRRRATISLPLDLYNQAEERYGRMGHKNFTSYVEFIVSKDVRERPPHVLSETGEGQAQAKKPSLREREES